MYHYHIHFLHLAYLVPLRRIQKEWPGQKCLRTPCPFHSSHLPSSHSLTYCSTLFSHTKRILCISLVHLTYLLNIFISSLFSPISGLSQILFDGIHLYAFCNYTMHLQSFLSIPNISYNPLL